MIQRRKCKRNTVLLRVLRRKLSYSFRNGENEIRFQKRVDVLFSCASFWFFLYLVPPYHTFPWFLGTPYITSYHFIHTSHSEISLFWLVQISLMAGLGFNTCFTYFSEFLDNCLCLLCRTFSFNQWRDRIYSLNLNQNQKFISWLLYKNVLSFLPFVRRHYLFCLLTFIFFLV